MGKMRNAYKILIQTLERKTPLRRLMCRWKDNIKMYVQDVKCEDVNWIHLVQKRDPYWACENLVMNLQVPPKAGNS
jgi:hypothetical protein